MSVQERALAFDCAGEELFGILSLPSKPSRVGVVIVVGGPQYRVGSHRQFALLARHLAAAGFSVLRFDARGMGDASGDFPGFENIDPDIAAATATLRREVPEVLQVVLWGLCDAASAALLSPKALEGIAGLVLLNPWVRNAETFASTEVKYYYKRRVLELEFWRKLLSGEVAIFSAFRDFLGKLLQQLPFRKQKVLKAGKTIDFRGRMVNGLMAFSGPVLVVLSGRDLVAAEFLEFCKEHPGMQDVWQRPTVARIDLVDADHTFSSRMHRAEVENATRNFLENLLRGRDS